MQSLVLGGTGIVGGLITQGLALPGEKPFALSSRRQTCSEGINWLLGDLSDPTSLVLSAVDVIFCTMQKRWFRFSKREIVCFTSTSILTKLQSEIEEERAAIRHLAEGEQQLGGCCDRPKIVGIILRPTLIYAEGRDANISRIASFALRFKFSRLLAWEAGFANRCMLKFWRLSLSQPRRPNARCARNYLAIVTIAAIVLWLCSLSHTT